MMEEIVLLETRLAKPHAEVFKLIPDQYRHLINNEKCAETEHRFGAIIDKYVIYRRGKPNRKESGISNPLAV